MACRMLLFPFMSLIFLELCCTYAFPSLSTSGTISGASINEISTVVSTAITPDPEFEKVSMNFHRTI